MSHATLAPILLVALPATLAPVLLVALPATLVAQWPQPPGEAWSEAVVWHHDTRDVYDTDGDAVPIFADGHSVTTSIYVNTAIGILHGLDAWVQAPFHFFSFDDAAGDRSRNGLGDLRFWLRVSPRLLGSDVPVALRGGVKVPGADFPIDPEVIPLSEGQVDWELILELGHSFWPKPFYAMGWVGYRWRTTNVEAARKPGDEIFAFLAAGGDIGSLFAWKLAGEGLWGRTPIIEGVAVSTAKRRIIQLLPVFGVNLGPGVVQLGGRIPLSGRNLPAGPALMAGYFFRWSIF